MVNLYQKMLDSRLSQPKLIQKVILGRKEVVFRNTPYLDQVKHKSIFNSPHRGQMSPQPVDKKAIDLGEEGAQRSFDNRAAA